LPPPLVKVESILKLASKEAAAKSTSCAKVPVQRQTLKSSIQTGFSLLI
jgi:hypothetical protein